MLADRNKTTMDKQHPLASHDGIAMIPQPTFGRLEAQHVAERAVRFAIVGCSRPLILDPKYMLCDPGSASGDFEKFASEIAEQRASALQAPVVVFRRVENACGRPRCRLELSTGLLC